MSFLGFINKFCLHPPCYLRLYESFILLFSGVIYSTGCIYAKIVSVLWDFYFLKSKFPLFSINFSLIFKSIFGSPQVRLYQTRQFVGGFASPTLLFCLKFLLGTRFSYFQDNFQSFLIVRGPQSKK